MSSLASPTRSISVDDLRGYFECPVCYEVPRSAPIYQCEKGHLICAECRPQLQSCPICRTDLIRNNRLLFAERLLEERLPLSCRYYEEGCPIELTLADLKRHENNCVFAPRPCENASLGCKVCPKTRDLPDHLLECPFRTVPCPLAPCPKKVVFKRMERHLRQEHFAPQPSKWWLARLCGAGDLERALIVVVAVCVLSLLVNVVLLWNI